MRMIALTATAALIAGTSAFAQSTQDTTETETTEMPAQGSIEISEDGGFTATGEARMANTMTTDVVDTITAVTDFSTLANAVQEAGLIQELKKDGPYTVFAPTNEAFEALPEEELNAILQDEDRLQELLKAHVVAGEVAAGDLSDGQEVETLAGDTVTVDMAGDEVSLGDAKVVATDLRTSNGVIHAIDKVIGVE